MKNYELLYIVNPRFTEEEVEPIKTEINELIAQKGGQIWHQENLGRRKLAYPISKALHGQYLVAEFELEDGSMLKGLNNSLELDKRILRAQLISRPKRTPEQIAASIRAEQNRSEKRQQEETKEDSGKKPTAKENKVNMQELDQKLDEILKEDETII